MEKQIIQFKSVFGDIVTFYGTIDNSLNHANDPFVLRKLEEANRRLEGLDLSPLFSSTKTESKSE